MAQPIEGYTPNRSGDFLSENRNPVRWMEVTEENETQDALLREHRVVMKDKTEYKLRETQPKSRKVDAPYIRTPAWTTSHNKGFEEAYAMTMADMGIAVYTVTPQQNRLRFGNMSKSSHDYIEMSQHLAWQRGLSTEHFITGGPSRGAMYALAMARAAAVHGAMVDYIDSVSPCVPKPIHKLNLAKAAGRLIHEPGSLVRIATSDTPGHTGLLINTIARPVREAAQQGKEFFALTDGTVGRAAQNLPADSFGFVQQYDTDGLAFPEQWPTILDRYGNIYQQYSPGTHMDCVSPEALLESIDRVGDIRDGYIAGGIGSTALHQLVAVGNPRFEGQRRDFVSIAPTA